MAKAARLRQGWLAIGRAWTAALCLSASVAQAADLRPFVSVERSTRLAAASHLRHDPSPSGLVALWLCSFDADHDVVAKALEAALARCHTEPHAICLSSLGFFVDEDSAARSGGWLGSAPAAIEDPSLLPSLLRRDSKLEVVSLLAGKLTTGQAMEPWLSALHMLAKDSEPAVQEAAHALLRDYVGERTLSDGNEQRDSDANG